MCPIKENIVLLGNFKFNDSDELIFRIPSDGKVGVARLGDESDMITNGKLVACFHVITSF